MRETKRIKYLLAILFLTAALTRSSAMADDRDDAYKILDEWTSVRWGEDNIAWAVFYPEELVDPWVRSEAERQKLKPEQAEELRKSFSNELRMGSATAVLLSVYAYGASPVDIGPLGQNIALIDSSGNRVSPIVFEKKLDSPISGLVQGFIFFPLQKDRDFKVTLKGLRPNRETSFAFAGAPGASVAIATVPQAPRTPLKPQKVPEKEVVVKIPTKTTPPPEKPIEPRPEAPVFEDPGETFPPTVPQTPPPVPSVDVPPPDTAPKPETPKLGGRQVLEIYLKAWLDGDADKMYSLLSSESQGRISKELFARDVMSGGFRSALKNGYKVNWSDDTAYVTVAKKVLFVRTLETKRVNFVEENGSSRVSW
ncbi:MAG: hypothetical protein LBT23_03615 [Synergistaceae bacterium]|nr:hypothetical protein [Synergistaceae bacterium]